MNRHERRALKKQQHDLVKDMKLPDRFMPIQPDQFPPLSRLPNEAFMNRKFLVQLFEENNPDYPGLIRLSINRTKLGSKGSWQENITWDELQQIKRELGFGEWYGV